MGRDQQWQQRYLQWRKTHPPIMGGAEDSDSDGASSEDNNLDNAPKPLTDEKPPDTPPDDPIDPGHPDYDPNSWGARYARVEQEAQRAKRELATIQKEKRQQERKAKELEDERKAEQGEWQKLAEERLQRVSELEEAIAERDRADAERAGRTRVEGIADRLGWRRPKRAYAILADEFGDDPQTLGETLSDEQLIEAALKRIARTEPELVDQARRTGAAIGSRSGGKPDPQREHSELIASLLGGGPTR